MFVAPAPYADYPSAFGWLMAGCGVALVLVVAQLRVSAAFFVAISPLLVGSLILTRFDLWPALLASAAMLALLTERHRLGWGFLGAAVAAKLWPLVIVPLAVVWSLRRGRLRAALVGLAVAALAFVPFAVIAPHGMWSSLHGQASRPLQIESLGASLFTTFGHPKIISSHGSQNVAGHGTVAALSTLLEIAILIVLWIAYARGASTSDRFVRFAVACVTTFIAFGKVLSPQYLIWLVPLVPLIRGLRGVVATALLALALVLTQVWFPQRYWDYVYAFHNAEVVLLRNVVLIVLLGVAVWPRFPESPVD